MRTLAVLAAALMSTAAHAQQVQLPPAGVLPVAATGVPAPDGPAGFPQPAAVRQDVLPVQPGIVPAAVTGPGAMPPASSPLQSAVPPNTVGQAQPGFGSPQGDAVQPLVPTSPAQQRLDTLRAKVEEKLATLDNAAPILSGSQLQQMQQRQMRIRETLMMGQEAKALAEVLKVLDDLSGDGSKGGASSDEDQKRKVDEAVQQALAARKLEEENAPKPLVASIHGSGGSLRAVVLVPYVGQFTVRAGTQLPDGMRVVSVSDNGVEVAKNGKRFPLAFGTVVPGMRPQPGTGPQGVSARTVQMPIGASPLPMGGFGSR